MPRQLSGRIGLAIALLVGAWLRSRHLLWGLPGFVFFDSLHYYVRPAYRLLRRGIWMPTQFVHPPWLAWVMAPTALLVGASSLGPDLNGTGITTEPVLVDLVVAGRLLTVAISLVQILAVYGLAHALFDSRTGVIAAALFAVLPFPSLEAHRISNDIPMLLMGTLAAHRAARAMRSGDTHELWLAFALGGAAGGFKYTGLALLSVPGWVALTWSQETPLRRIRRLAIGTVIAAATFGLLMTPALLAGDAFVRELRLILTVGMGVGRRGVDLAGAGWVYTRWVYAAVAALPFMMGWPAYLAGLAGLGWLPRASPRAAGLVWAGFGPFFLLQGAAETVEIRYFLPLAPFLVVAAAALLARAWVWRRHVGGLLLVAVLTYGLFLSHSHVARMDGAPAKRVEKVIAAVHTAVAPARVRVAHPDPLWIKWDPLRPLLEGPSVAIVPFPPNGRRPASSRPATRRRYGAWLGRERIDVVLIPSQIADVWPRERSSENDAVLKALLDGRELDFVSLGRIRTPFLNEDLYLWADPMLDTILTAGVIAYDVYVRAPLVGALDLDAR